MKRILLTLTILGLSVCAQADQLLYNADTGKRTITLKNNGDLWGVEYGEHFLWGHLEGDIIYDHNDVHSIGYRKGKFLYGNNGHLIGYFDKP